MCSNVHHVHDLVSSSSESDDNLGIFTDTTSSDTKRMRKKTKNMKKYKQ